MIVAADEPSIRRAAQLLREGRLVAFPTETVYGLGADATQDKAVAQVFAVKGRPAFNPLIVHVPSIEEAAALGEFNAEASELGKLFWPGPLTLVVPRRQGCPVSLLATAGLLLTQYENARAWLGGGEGQDRPLSGIRVLDLTRILAGPVCARTLAEHGAEVLMVTAERLPQIAEHVMDTSHGKRSCFLDLGVAQDGAQLKALVKGADVFSQGYRPGMIGQLGFGPEQVAAIRPGIVYTTISCYGADGPFSHRGGWEQVAQTVTGICHDNNPQRPHLLPAAACDYTTGYLAAYGVMLALARRAVEGGSYHVRVSLCQSGMFIQRQGLLAQAPAPSQDLSGAELDQIRIETHPAHLGPLRHLGPIVRMSETPARWIRATPRLGGDRPEWPVAR